MSIPVGEDYEVNERFYGSMGIDMPRIIKTPNYLKEKVGDDVIDEFAIMQCQSVLDTVDVDFTDDAEFYINNVKEIVTTLRGIDYGREEQYYDQVLDPIMALKAGGGMFLYKPIYKLSNLMQSFLERVYRLDDDVLDILHAYETSIRMCIYKYPKDAEHPLVLKLVSELERACVRYVQKAAKASKG